MPDNLPAHPSPARSISREALERIIQRAAELQASELDTGEAITEQELLKLGADVGIDGRFLRQAIYEEAAGPRQRETGFAARWFGPAAVGAGRVVPGDREAVEKALEHWMTEGEALTTKRRMPDRTVWERQKGFFAEMKRGFGVGGKSYHLAKAEDVTVVVTQLETGFCHVEITANIRGKRNAVATATTATAGVLGALGVGVLAVLSVPLPFLPVAAAPLVAAVAAPTIGSHTQRKFAQNMQLAVEQVLDRLERGEIKPRHQTTPRGGLADLGAMLFDKVNAEVRRAIETSGRVDEKRRLGG
jgi:hypothetical protein